MSYQSEYSGAQVDEAVGKALNADAAPTAGSTNLVQSGGVASAVSALMGSISHRNLLDNGWFTINQRGLTSYAWNGIQYSVDRWKWDTLSTAPLEVQSDGVNLNGSALTVGSPYMRQIIDNPTAYRGKTMTLSAIVSAVSGAPNNGFLRVYSGSGTAWGVYFGTDVGLWTVTFTVPADAAAFVCDIGAYTGKSVKVVAAKLELGSVSTLANDVAPNYAEELAKCQYYFYRVKAGEPLYGSRSIGAANYSSFRVPVIMRGTPTATKNGGTITIYGQNGTQYGFSSFNNGNIAYNAIGVYLTQSASYAGEKLIIFNAGGTIDLSADL